MITRSCNNDSIVESKRINSSESKTITDLSLLNESFRNKKKTETISSWWKEFKRGVMISAADIAGVGAGIAAVKEVAALVGVTTGGTGAVVVCSVGGVVCGAGASIAAYEALPEAEIYIEEESERAILWMPDNDDIINLYQANECESDCSDDSIHYEYNYILSKLNIPEEFTYLRRVGEDHNTIIKSSVIQTTERSTTRNSEQDIEEPEELPVIEEEVVEAVSAVLDDEEYNLIKYRMPESVKASYTSESFDCDLFFTKEPLKSKRLEDALKLYISLFQNYPDNLDEIVEIANEYIYIIEKNNEFTSGEKESIYASLIISLYSPQLWR